MAVTETSDFALWVRLLGEKLTELAAEDVEHRRGTNVILAPVSPRPDVPRLLEPLYEVCDGVRLPGVFVGYFIDPASRVASAVERGQPIRIEVKPTKRPDWAPEPKRSAGPRPGSIHVFGSDGGGGRFAIETSDGSVHYLPSSGAVRGGVFFEDWAAVPERVAENLIGFLWRLKADVDAFADGNDDHAYMAR